MSGQQFDSENPLGDFDFDLSDFNFDELDQNYGQQQYDESGQQQYQYQQQQYDSQQQMQPDQQQQQGQIGYEQNVQDPTVQDYGYPGNSDGYQSQAGMSQSSDYGGYQQASTVIESAPEPEEPQEQQPQVQPETQNPSLKRPHPDTEQEPSSSQQSEPVNPDDVVFAVPELPIRKIAKAQHSLATGDQSDANESTESSGEPSSSSDKETSLTDKTHINLLRQTVLHPVAPNIVEKMHSLPPVKESEEDELKTLVLNLQRYESVIPDSAARYVMSRSGINPGPGTDICARYLAVAAQKVVTDVLSDAITMAKSRGMGQTNRSTKETKYLLTQDLVSEVLHEHGFSNTR